MHFLGSQFLSGPVIIIKTILPQQLKCEGFHLRIPANPHASWRRGELIPTLQMWTWGLETVKNCAISKWQNWCWAHTVRLQPEFFLPQSPTTLPSPSPVLSREDLQTHRIDCGADMGDFAPSLQEAFFSLNHPNRLFPNKCPLNSLPKVVLQLSLLYHFHQPTKKNNLFPKWVQRSH